MLPVCLTQRFNHIQSSLVPVIATSLRCSLELRDIFGFETFDRLCVSLDRAVESQCIVKTLTSSPFNEQRAIQVGVFDETTPTMNF